MKANDTIFVLMTAAALLVAAPSAFADVEPAGNPTATRQAIQAAIDAAAPTGGTVTLSAGTFEIDAQLMVTNGVTLVGQGWDSTIIKQTALSRVATIDGKSKMEGVAITGGHLREKSSGAGVLVTSGTISWCCITNNQIGDASWQGTTINNVYGAGVHVKQGVIDHSVIAWNTSYMNGR